MNIIQFPNRREEESKLDLEFHTTDRRGRDMFLFAADYEYDDRSFTISFWAYDMADAEQRVVEMRAGLVLQGQIVYST